MKTFAIFGPFNQKLHRAKYIITAPMAKLLLFFFYFFALTYIKMSGKNINFDNKKIKTKTEINKNKKLFQIEDVDVNKILISKKEPYGAKNSFKYFIGY